MNATATVIATDVGSDPYTVYRRTLLKPERVRELSKLQPARAVIDALRCWFLIVASWALVAAIPSWWTVALSILVTSTQYYALLIVGHDGIHRRLFRSMKVNDWFGDIFVFAPVGAITRINNQNHLGHHRHLSTADDPDLHQFTCANKYRWHMLVGYLSGTTSIWRSFQNVFIRRGGPDAVVEVSTAKLGASSFTFRDITLIAVWQIALIGGLTWLVAWWAYPLLWLVPLYLAFAFDNLRAFAEHSQPEPDETANEHRLITFLSNPLERMFISPLNMNYHAAHHLWPAIPYYNLPKADREIRDMPGAQGLEWRGTYVGYLVRYFRRLPIEDCRPAAPATN